MRRHSRAPHRLPLAALAALFCCAAWAQDSGVGVDFQFGTELAPAGRQAAECDPRGASWLRADAHRSPGGSLYRCPPQRVMSGEEWLRWGSVEFGWMSASGDVSNADWLRFNGWDDGIVLGLLDISLVRPEDGRYVDLRASRLNADNQFIKATIGQAGRYRIEAFARTQPNVVSGAAKSIWDGIGSNRLTLRDGLIPAASTPEQVAAVSAASPERILQVTRDKFGVGVNYFFDRRWTAYAHATSEQREGARPFGGAFFFNYPFPANGGIYETPRPIDDATVNFNGGLRFVGGRWRMEVGYSGSFYRSADTGWTYENPYALYPVVPGAVSRPILGGGFASEPDNDYHNLRLSLTRKLASMNGEFGIAVAGGTMRQNDDLLAPIDCQGQFGIDLSPTGAPVNPFLYDCADWNSTAALSRQTADMRIDTSRVDSHLVLQPSSSLTLRAHGKFHREDYRNVYVAYNPLTGQYGYIAANGSMGSVVPNEMGVFDPVGAPSVKWRVTSLPLDKETRELALGADWRLSRANTLGLQYVYTGIERTYREREDVDSQQFKLTWSNRALEKVVLRANYSYTRQSGDEYNFDPYHDTFSVILPGYVPDPAGSPHTVDALRKYELADRDQHKLTLIATFMPRPDMSLNATLRGDWNDYDAELGRQGHDSQGVSVSWDWQPSALSNLSAYAAWDRSDLEIANVNDTGGGADDPTLGGAVYGNDGRWWVDDSQRNRNVGVSFDHRFGRARLDIGWNWLHARGVTSYAFADALALAYPALADVAGTRFPTMTYRVNALDIGFSVPVNDRVTVRLFDRYERGRIKDWHYQGLDRGLVIDHRIYLDSGPVGYSSNLVGLMLEVQL
ncbi:MAG: MtrB/PioB family outer membrane beta-barrel protein [Lysobacteraceae bacterium]